MQKIKTATLTFHASHNYGSMLQAYALQQILINELGVDNEIINFRSPLQKKCYQFPTNKKMCLKDYILKNVLGSYENELIEKYYLFEKFLNEKLILSREFEDEKKCSEYARKFDFLISGSDQIWNTSCVDFNWIYFLPSAKNNAIAYAPSMGPNSKQEVKEENYSKINNYLQQYKAISVREQGSADIVKSIIDKDVEILVDPTLLIRKDEWDNLSGNEPIVKGEYIFMYHPFVNAEICKMSQNISKYTNLPVIVSNKIPYRVELKNRLLLKKHLHYKLNVGPIEFLNLLKNAKYVISGSFHAVVFSIIFNKPFLAVEGKTDNRISQLLNSTGLLDYGVNMNDYLQAIGYLSDIDFTQAVLYIKNEKERSLEYLKNALHM